MALVFLKPSHNCFLRRLSSVSALNHHPVTRCSSPLPLYRFHSTSGKPPPPPPPPEEDNGARTSSEASYTQPAHKLSQSVTAAEEHAYKNQLDSHLDKQAKSPWLRAGADHPPVEKIGKKEKVVRGKLLTTPSRLLKLVIPLANEADQQQDGEDGKRDFEPLALLVHPSQPLSYLERLVQSELPTLKDRGKERVRSVEFRAPESVKDEDNNGEADAEASSESGEGRCHRH